MKTATRMLDLPDIGDLFRATAPTAGEQPPLTFYVTVSPDHAVSYTHLRAHET